jgi:branched-chain amino acid transport system permease protein
MFLAQMILFGLVNGAIYALMAVGMVVIYKASNVLNFGYGQIAAVAAFVSYTLLVNNGYSWFMALPAGVAASVALSLAVENFVAHPLQQQRPLTIMVGTLGISLILSGLITLQWGPAPKIYPPIVEGNAMILSGLALTFSQAVMLGVTLAVVVLLSAFFKYTRFGLSMRAAADNQTVATLLGINLRIVSLTSWSLGGGVGGLAAMLIAPQMSLTPDAFTFLMIQAFMAVVIAGFTNLLAAILGGFITGVALNLFAGYVITNMPNTFLMVLLLGILLLRPYGLFGKQEATHP